MPNGFGNTWGQAWGSAATTTPVVSSHVWMPRMDNGVPSVVDIRGGVSTGGTVAPASAPNTVGFTALVLDEQWSAIDTAKWTIANNVASTATAFMAVNATAGAGTIGASGGSSLALATKRVTVGAASFTGGQLTSTSSLKLPLYGYFMARVKIPHGQGLAPMWKLAAKNGAAIASITVQYLHAVTPGRIGVTYAHQTAAGVSAPAVAANAFFEAPTYTPGWHTLALSLEPVNGMSSAAGVLIRGYIDGVKSFETTDTTASYWTANGGAADDFWTMTWQGSQVDGQFIAGPDDVLGVDDQRGVCSISGTYPGACLITATDGRSIIRAGAAGSTATMGTAATTFEVDYLRAWAYATTTAAITGSWTTTATWAWSDSALLGNTPTADQYAAVSVTGLDADDQHNAAIKFRYGAAGNVLVGISDRTWRIEGVASGVITGSFTAGNTAGLLEADVTGPATATVVHIYWTPSGGARTAVATQTVTTAAGIATQTGLVLSIWQSTATVSMTSFSATSSGTPSGGGGGGGTTPTAPAAPSLSGSAANGQAIMTWTVVSGATSYTLKQGTTTVYSGTATTATITGLTNGTGYTFTVTASNSAGTSAASNAITVTPQAPVTTGSWLSGAGGLDSMAQISGWGSDRGKAVTFVTDWSDNSPENQATADYNLMSGGKFATYSGHMILAMGGIFKPNGETWAAAASGAYDARWTQTFQNARTNWTRVQRGELWIEFAHEYNGYAWQGIWGVPPAEVSAFKTATARCRAIKDRYFPECKFGVTGNGQTNTDARGNYGAGVLGGLINTITPGTVEFYGADIYVDHYAASTSCFTDHKSIADALGVPFAIPEWGLHGITSDSGYSVNYLNAINAFGRAGKIARDAYFNVDYGTAPDQLFKIWPIPGSFPIGSPYYFRTLGPTWGS